MHACWVWVSMPAQLLRKCHSIAEVPQPAEHGVTCSYVACVQAVAITQIGGFGTQVRTVSVHVALQGGLHMLCCIW